MSLNSAYPINNLPHRIKYYLQDWKDNNMNRYISTYGERGIWELSFKELETLFFTATFEDQNLIEEFKNK
jgi:hypothetical protein